MGKKWTQNFKDDIAIRLNVPLLPSTAIDERQRWLTVDEDGKRYAGTITPPLSGRGISESETFQGSLKIYSN